MLGIHIDTSELAAVLERNAREFAVDLGLREVGAVIEAADGIAIVSGLPGVMAEEMVVFSNDVHGMVMNLDRDHVGVIVLGDHSSVEQGDTVRRTGAVLRTPVGESLLGRVVTPLGRPIDGRGPITSTEFREVEADAPGIIDRQALNTPLQTGIKSIDAMTAIARGQRELIIGDRQTGKTSVALDAILNQRPGDVRCVYVAIGQKLSTVAALARTLEARGVLENCIVIAATAADAAPLQYIAPFAGCAMAEYFRDNGQDALIVYDDLSKHAVAYREISLLLRRSPGREAFPGDIFYLHSRLLERACRLSAARGGGSLTALPIAETQQGDYSAYIPTNLVSITDGQIYLDGDLFHQGFRPAVNVGLSVSRVGGKAQWPAMKKVAITLRLDLAQYREIASFAELTSDLDRATLKQLHRGERLAEALKQPQGTPLPVTRQIGILWAAVQGYLDDLALCDVDRFQSEWFALVDHAYPHIGARIRETKDLGPDVVADLRASIEHFKKVFAPTREAPMIDPERVVPRNDDAGARVSDAMMSVS